jgi:hypothetical protein
MDRAISRERNLCCALASHRGRLGLGEPDLAKIPRDAHPALGIVCTSDPETEYVDTVRTRTLTRACQPYAAASWACVTGGRRIDGGSAVGH